jgi:charged multivesicular body protein 4
MNAMKKELDIDKVDDMMGEIQENAQAFSEVSAALSNPLGTDGVDEVDVEAELDELKMEADEEEVDEPVVKTKKPAPKIPTHLPEAPTGKVELSVEDDDEELNRLMKEMN